jgi:MOSC N-terminal beta barrel domain
MQPSVPRCGGRSERAAKQQPTVWPRNRHVVWIDDRIGQQSGNIRASRRGLLCPCPVKSMLGTTVNEIFITEHGALGDRAWALRDVESGRIASAKRFPRLLEFRATYEVEPTREKPGRVRIETPDGQAVDPDDPDASGLISNILGRTLQLIAADRSSTSSSSKAEPL